MIKSELIQIGNNAFRKTFSDAGYKIRQKETGAVYDDAVDVLTANYAYEETDELIAKEEGA